MFRLRKRTPRIYPVVSYLYVSVSIRKDMYNVREFFPLTSEYVFKSVSHFLSVCLSHPGIEYNTLGIGRAGSEWTARGSHR